MVKQGYPAVTYRALAAKAGVTPSLVQYYFPTLDSIFIAALRRRTAENVQRLRDALSERPAEILHMMWEFSWEEATGALVTEFMALGHHHESVGIELAEVTAQIRQVQLDALTARPAGAGGSNHISAGALVILISGIPKMLNLERGIGVATAHDDVIAAFETYIDTIEPPPNSQKGRTAHRS